MTDVFELENYTNTLLDITAFADYCPNGLQVEGKPSVKKLVCGVTACQAFIDSAIEQQADAVLVHHGFFWKGDNACVVGTLKRRLAKLLNHEVSMLAYHLPLDAHPKFGNNKCLADVIGIKVTGAFEVGVPGLGWLGELTSPCTASEFSERLTTNLQRAPLHISGGVQKIQRVAWCSGAAQDFIVQAADANVDAYISGEVSERTVHLARELGLDYFAAGHHATERYGIQALAQHLAERFGLDWLFIDIENPA